MTDRRTIAEALLFQGNKLVTAGLVVGSGGNLSGRVPDGEGFPITPSGYSLAELTPELAKAVAAQLEGAEVVLLKHHGCLLVAGTPDLAYQRAMNLESAAMATYRAVQLGDNDTVTPPQYMEWIHGLEAQGKGYGKS